jgi:hypothetical protein
MNKISPVALLTVGATLVTVFATFGATPTHAASATPAEVRYQQDRANCLAGKTNEDQKTCLKEAGASLEAARQHDLKSADPAAWAANERKRCEPMTGDDKKACLAMADGQGVTNGSVASGGELHTLVTVTPGVPPHAAPSPNAMPAPNGH